MKQHFYLKLNPSRPTFAQDMSAQERAVMERHIAYMQKLMEAGEVIAYGPVMDPAGIYGIGILEVESLERAQQIAAEDPAAQLNRYEIFPMRAVFLPRHIPSLG